MFYKIKCDFFRLSFICRFSQGSFPRFHQKVFKRNKSLTFTKL